MRRLFDSLVLLSASGAQSSGYRVLPSTRTMYSVRLWGRLQPLWADCFSLGLSNLGISILNGFARQDSSGSWGAEFLITPTSAAIDPLAVDYLSLTRDIPSSEGAPFLLDDYALDGSPECGAVLQLEVRGPDRVGFLGSLLRALGRLSLVPYTMTVVTREGQACDRFALKTADGRVPSDETRRALEAVLHARCRTAAPRDNPTSVSDGGMTANV